MSTRTATGARVFISAIGQDRDWARRLGRAVRQLGIASSLDVQGQEADDDGEERLRRALKRSSHVVFVLSREAAVSPFIAFMSGAALAADKQILSVVATDVPRDEIFEPLTRRPILRKGEPSEVAREIASVIGK